MAASVDRAFGEAVLLTRYRSGGQQKGPQPDPTRPARQLVAVFHEPVATEKPDAAMSGRHYFVGSVEGASRSATIALSAFASPDDWPAAPDRLQQLEADGAPTAEVLKAVPNDAGRLVVTLTRIAS